MNRYVCSLSLDAGLPRHGAVLPVGGFDAKTPLAAARAFARQEGLSPTGEATPVVIGVSRGPGETALSPDDWEVHFEVTTPEGAAGTFKCRVRRIGPAERVTPFGGGGPRPGAGPGDA